MTWHWWFIPAAWIVVGITGTVFLGWLGSHYERRKTEAEAEAYRWAREHPEWAVTVSPTRTRSVRDSDR